MTHDRPPAILMRKPEPADLEALFHQKNDPEVKRLLGGFSRPQSHTDLQQWLESHRTRPDEVLWSILSEETGRCLGHVGLYKVDPISRSAELGIMIGDRSVWGLGIGRVATLFAIRHAFFNENLNRVSLTVLVSNDRAKRLYHKVGFVQEGLFRQAQFKDGKYVDVIAMALLREEFVDVA